MCTEPIETEELRRNVSATTIAVDYRERPSGIVEVLRARGDAQVHVQHLKVGDYLIDDCVVVERKTLDDFALSVIDTRLFRQAARLNVSRWRPVILLEGKKLSKAIPRSAFNGALISLALIFDIPILRTRDVEESARVLCYCAHQLGERSPRRYGRVKPEQPELRQLYVLTSLPRIGDKTARRLLQHFGTVERCFSASEEELCAVPGIGDKTAQEIRRIVGSENAE